MRERVRDQGIGTDFSHDKSGFLEFVEEIGPYPLHMSRPTIGRKDHSKGYIRDNFAWQEYSDNYSEAASRFLPARFRTDETIRRISASQKGRKFSEEHKKHLSEAWERRRNL